MDPIQDKSLSSGLFFLDLLSAVEPRVVNWNLVTKGESGMLSCKHKICMKLTLLGWLTKWTVIVSD